VHAAAAAAAAGKRDIERLLGEARGELRIGQLGAPRLEGGFDLQFYGIEFLAEVLALLRRDRLEGRLQRGKRATLTEVARFLCASLPN